MRLHYSDFARRFVAPTGTRMLMDDLGEVLGGATAYHNLGGGNPAIIPEMQALFRGHLQQALDSGEFDRISSAYDGPQGHRPFLEAVAELFATRFGWPITADNVAMTAGSQSTFFILFNAFAGRGEDGVTRQVHLPLTPEYIGYADVAAVPDALAAAPPHIELLDGRRFKYHIDFEKFALTDTTGAVCVSRPTNPTGNVLSQEEMSRLVAITRTAGVPLIVDNAYGTPFPGICFDAAAPVYDGHVINCFSLSKLGLPGLRTGIVIADPAVIELVRSMNAIQSLATGSLGALIATGMMADGSILEHAEHTIRPFYAARSAAALDWCDTYFDGLDYRVHVSEGAIFLWLWFPGLPGGSQALYERLKARQVLVIPGHHFFPGLAPASPTPWRHREECIRISYAQAPEQVEAGIRTIAEEVKRDFAA